MTLNLVPGRKQPLDRDTCDTAKTVKNIPLKISASRTGIQGEKIEDNETFDIMQGVEEQAEAYQTKGQKSTKPAQDSKRRPDPPRTLQ